MLMERDDDAHAGETATEIVQGRVVIMRSSLCWSAGAGVSPFTLAR